LSAPVSCAKTKYANVNADMLVCVSCSKKRESRKPDLMPTYARRSYNQYQFRLGNNFIHSIEHYSPLPPIIVTKQLSDIKLRFCHSIHFSVTPFALCHRFRTSDARKSTTISAHEEFLSHIFPRFATRFFRRCGTDVILPRKS
jgi:hypothetical protein